MPSKQPQRPPTFEELFGLDMLHRALGYLKEQFSIAMPRPEAAAHFEARVLLWNAQNKILEDLGVGVTRREVQQAQAKQRGGCHG